MLYEGNNEKKAGFLYLRAAWVFDDANDNISAKKYRTMAVEHLGKYVSETPDANVAVTLVDVQRRAQMYDDAIELANDLLEYGVEGILPKILDFEIQLCKNQDAAVYTLGSVLDR